MSPENVKTSSEIESFRKMTFKGSTVLSIIFFLVSLFGAVGWFLFTQGAFTPDTKLSQDFAISQYRYENLVKDYDEARSTVSVLEKRNLDLSGEIARLRAGVESERVQSEERIRIKQLELENERLLKIAETESTTRISEAEAERTVSEQNSLARKIESENESRARIISACVEAKAVAVSGTGLYVAGTFLDDCNREYEIRHFTNED